ncbi:DEAD/DEAH box helicase [Candidatus Bathyarchaeota archaeon]|nr:DEAD/DEAH box helicase [Candidatus Bathyarchaeota archaeon]
MRFEELPISLAVKRGLKDREFTDLFPIQKATIPLLLNGRNVIGQAKTGTGKTAAFGVPLIERIDWEKKTLQGLVLTPTRELALQVSDDLRSYAKYTPIRVLTVYGGVSVEDQINELMKGVHIVVGTPGRIIDLLDRGSLKLDGVKVLVLDEADRMLDMGFIEDIEYILKRTPRKKQMSLWSATIDERTLRLSRRYMPDAEKVFVSGDEIAVEEIDQRYIRVASYEKFEVLVKLINHMGIDRALIFCRMREDAEELAEKLKSAGYDAEAIHGQISQKRREKTLKAFKDRRLRLMVATELAARGLDIEDILFIINYAIPEDPYMYFHRIGRTARAGKTGVAITLVSFGEEEELERIAALTNTRIKKMTLPPDFLL